MLRAMAPKRTTSPPGSFVFQRGSRNSSAARPAPDGESCPVGLRQLPDDAGQFLDGVALGLVHAKQLVELAHGDEDGQAHDEAVHHRLGKELGDEAQPRQPGDQKDQPDTRTKAEA